VLKKREDVTYWLCQSVKVVISVIVLRKLSYQSIIKLLSDWSVKLCYQSMFF